jgi:ribulose-phosphate 3-epimerase
MSKVQIIPAILPKDYSQLENQVEDVSQNTDCVQVDICDGQFVPNATWPYKKHDNNFEQLLSEQKGLPHWEEIDFEFDLMVNRPEEVVLDWMRVGATRMILHVESKGDIGKAIDLVSNDVEIGLAINIETDLAVLSPFADKISFIQCMGIDRIGYQGQDFDKKVIDKIKAIKKLYPDKIVSVDGGVNLDNANDLILAGAERLVVGSAIFDSENVYEALANFNQLAKSIK